MIVLLIKNQCLREPHLPNRFGYGVFASILYTHLATPSMPSASPLLYTPRRIQCELIISIWLRDYQTLELFVYS